MCDHPSGQPLVDGGLETIRPSLKFNDAEHLQQIELD